MLSVMAMEDILDLPSVDSDGMSFGNIDPVHIVIEGKWVDSPEYREISESMKAAGINEVAIHVGLAEDVFPAYNLTCPEDLKGTLAMGNGHHRVKLCLALGFTGMMVTDNRDDSGW